MTARKILVTAGPTIEPLDPVRFISNRSTGTMGYAIAEECARKGFAVRLVSGPVALDPPEGVELFPVETAKEMRERVMEHIEGCAGIIMSAAVCDFRPETRKPQKIKKRDEMTLKLVKNPDILEGLKKKKDLVKIGFALETENAVENGRAKLAAKGLDLIIVNKAGKEEDPFGSAPGRAGGSRYTMIDSTGDIKEIDKATKRGMAANIVAEMEKRLP